MMKIQEIRLLAKELSVNSFGKSKVDLIREIQRAQGNFDCFGSAVDYCDQLECAFREPCLSEQKTKKKRSK